MTDSTLSLLRWLAAHDVPRRMVLLCPDAPVPDIGRGAVAVRLTGCVADASIGLPAQLLACGVGEVAVVICGDRAEEVRALGERWRATIVTGVEIVESPPPPGRWRKAPEVLTLGAIPVSRRGLLGLAGAGPFPLDLDGDDTARTLAALDLLRARGQAVLEVREESPARALAVDGCTACGVCVHACPHDALSLTHDGAVSKLVHLRDACRGELDCMRLCPMEAISDGGPIPFDDLAGEPGRVLAAVATTACPRCQARHAGGRGTYCAACAFRVANPFGTSAPPGAKRS
ncbi:MAG: 4Fe-4S binding protein [Tessaracoccus sp.]|uniref:4Fe-4S dicluster domain-containing protein n=1 Tax=Tessaracoccus sp. TaxID=1971211 RepID=UPI001ED4AA8A|nr:4Fe-4S dicluster domain-containing protein [Tessaracoccus sp.]MBK7822757.1 4Fe-4S binding protein [Tessaracoccus sp.]